ncbi:MAG TPA: peptidyl-prolyl cis-trans isomerase, partial [Terriglobales bacterium]
ATPDDVREELQHGQYAAFLFPAGNYIGREKYEELLQQNDMTVDQFEDNVKNEILLRKLRNLVAASAVITDSEVHDQFLKQNTKVKFDYAVLNLADLKKGIHPTDAELKAFYERSKPAYANSVPEKRKIAYVLIDTEKIEKDVTVSSEDLQAYYNLHRDEYRQPEQVNVRHILVKTPPPGPDGKVDQKALDAAKAKAEGLLKQIKAGANFADVAKNNSDDPGSAKNGGSLNWVRRNTGLDPAFEQAAFSLPKGGTSDLVKSSFGFHIIHVDDRQEAHVKTLDDVKAQIEPVIRKNKAARIAENQANALLSQVRSSTLEKAAAAKNLSVTTTDFFGRGGSLPGIGVSPQFMDAVFAQAEKAPPDMAQTGQGSYVIYQVLAVKPPATPTFEEIRSRVEQEFVNERANVLLSQKTQELSDRAKAAHDLKKAAKELGATVKTSEFVLPDGQVPEIGSLRGPAAVAFTMKPGEISGPVTNGTNGAALHILERQDPTAEDFAQKKDQIRDQLVQQKKNELFGMFVSNLRQSMEKSGKIRINQEEMKALSRGNEQGE